MEEVGVQLARNAIEDQGGAEQDQDQKYGRNRLAAVVESAVLRNGETPERDELRA